VAEPRGGEDGGGGTQWLSLEVGLGHARLGKVLHHWFPVMGAWSACGWCRSTYLACTELATWPAQSLLLALPIACAACAET
jgi:hypothetical protein